MFKMIVAMSQKRGIGYKNTLPWLSLSKDMKYFKNKTIGKGNNCVVMGRNTWESLGVTKKEPLPKRDKIIMSRSIDNIDMARTSIAKNMDEVFRLCDKKKYDEVWVIGGEEIYKLFIDEDQLEEIYITEIQRDYKCDTFFPKLSDSFFLSHTTETAWEKNIGFRFTKWEKKDILQLELIANGMHPF